MFILWYIYAFGWRFYPEFIYIVFKCYFNDQKCFLWFYFQIILGNKRTIYSHCCANINKHEKDGTQHQQYGHAGLPSEYI